MWFRIPVNPKKKNNSYTKSALKNLDNTRCLKLLLYKLSS
jgi:hypothetical protein